jgi:maleylpyruvate isomerase
MSLQLSTFWRSSAAYRVRIALGLKGLPYDAVFINLAKGEQSAAAYRAQNPQGRVPFLQDGDFGLGQSLAIIDYLDEVQPNPPLLPFDSKQKAEVRAFALAIACDIHPLNNLAVLKYLKDPLGQSQEAIDTWYRHWICEGFAALEPHVSGPYVFGDTPSLADICLVPQLYNARRFNTDVSAFPKLAAADAHARAHPAFAAAAPEAQPDAA